MVSLRKTKDKKKKTYICASLILSVIMVFGLLTSYGGYAYADVDDGFFYIEGAPQIIGWTESGAGLANTAYVNSPPTNLKLFATNNDSSNWTNGTYELSYTPFDGMGGASSGTCPLPTTDGYEGFDFYSELGELCGGAAFSEDGLYTIYVLLPSEGNRRLRYGIYLDRTDPEITLNVVDAPHHCAFENYDCCRTYGCMGFGEGHWEDGYDDLGYPSSVFVPEPYCGGDTSWDWILENTPDETAWYQNTNKGCGTCAPYWDDVSYQEGVTMYAEDVLDLEFRFNSAEIARVDWNIDGFDLSQFPYTYNHDMWVTDYDNNFGNGSLYLRFGRGELPLGEHVIEVIVEDLAGNTSSYYYTVNNLGPEGGMRIIEPGTITNDPDTILIKWSANTPASETNNAYELVITANPILENFNYESRLSEYMEDPFDQGGTITLDSIELAMLLGSNQLDDGTLTVAELDELVQQMRDFGYSWMGDVYSFPTLSSGQPFAIYVTVTNDFVRSHVGMGWYPEEEEEAFVKYSEDLNSHFIVDTVAQDIVYSGIANGSTVSDLPGNRSWFSDYYNGLYYQPLADTPPLIFNYEQYAEDGWVRDYSDITLPGASPGFEWILPVEDVYGWDDYFQEDLWFGQAPIKPGLEIEVSFPDASTGTWFQSIEALVGSDFRTIVDSAYNSYSTLYPAYPENEDGFGGYSVLYPYKNLFGEYTVTATTLDAAGNRSEPYVVSFTYMPELVFEGVSDGDVMQSLDPSTINLKFTNYEQSDYYGSFTITNAVRDGGEAQLSNINLGIGDLSNAGLDVYDILDEGWTRGYAPWTSSVTGDLRVTNIASKSSDLASFLSEDGEYEITAKYTNDLFEGVTEFSTTIRFTVDSVAPTVTYSGIVDGSRVNSVPELTANSDDPYYLRDGAKMTLEILAPGASTSTKQDYDNVNQIIYDAFTVDGLYTITIGAIDSGENSATPATLSFTLDRVAPNLSYTGVVSGSTVYSSPELTFFNDDVDYLENGAKMTVSILAPGAPLPLVLDYNNENEINPNPFGSFGDYTITLGAVDAAGNWATPVSFTFTLSEPEPCDFVPSPLSPNKDERKLGFSVESGMILPATISVVFDFGDLVISGTASKVDFDMVDYTDTFYSRVAVEDRGSFYTLNIPSYQRNDFSALEEGTPFTVRVTDIDGGHAWSEEGEGIINHAPVFAQGPSIFLSDIELPDPDAADAMSNINDLLVNDSGAGNALIDNIVDVEDGVVSSVSVEMGSYRNLYDMASSSTHVLPEGLYFVEITAEDSNNYKTTYNRAIIVESFSDGDGDGDIDQSSGDWNYVYDVASEGVLYAKAYELSLPDSVASSVANHPDSKAEIIYRADAKAWSLVDGTPVNIQAHHIIEMAGYRRQDGIFRGILFNVPSEDYSWSNPNIWSWTTNIPT